MLAAPSRQAHECREPVQQAGAAGVHPRHGGKLAAGVSHNSRCRSGRAGSCSAPPPALSPSCRALQRCLQRCLQRLLCLPCLLQNDLAKLKGQAGCVLRSSFCCAQRGLRHIIIADCHATLRSPQTPVFLQAAQQCPQLKGSQQGSCRTVKSLLGQGRADQLVKKTIKQSQPAADPEVPREALELIFGFLWELISFRMLFY